MTLDRTALWTAAILSSAVAILTPPDMAWAGGFHIPGRGARAAGRAGAAVVGGDDLSALWYNPANIGALDQHHLLLDVGLIDANFEFRRAGRTDNDGRSVTYPEPAENTGAAIPIPMIAYATDLGLESWVLSVGTYGPYAASYRFPADGPQRYSSISGENTIIAVTQATVAYRLGRRLRLGVGLQNYILDLNSMSAASTYSGIFGRSEDEDLDLRLQLRVTDAWNPTANFGAWVAIWRGLEAGASVQLPVQFDARGTMRIRLPHHVYFDGSWVEHVADDGTVTRDEVPTRFEFRLPLILRGGLRYTGTGPLVGAADTFDVEADLIFERWSELRTIAVDPQGTLRNLPSVGDSQLRDLSVVLDMKDTYSARLGGAYRMSSLSTVDAVELRLGYAYETEARRDATYSTLLSDAARHTVAVGVSVQLGMTTVDLSYAHLFVASRHVTTSALRQVNPSDADLEVQGIGNGDYTSSFNMLAVGVRLAWGQGT